MESIKAIIIEDEEASRITLQNLVRDYCQGIEIIAHASNVIDGVKIIETYHPDLVFLDIELPLHSGFKLFDFFHKPDFDVIFTTAYDDFALRALKLSAIDYLLKPIDLAELRSAIQKLQHRRTDPQNFRRISALKENLGTKIHKITLPTQQGFEFVKLDQIVYCEASGNYTVFHQVKAKKILVSKTLKTFSEILESNGFFRISRSHLINLKHVVKYIRQKNPIIEMSNEAQLSISQKKKEAFIDRVRHFL